MVASDKDKARRRLERLAWYLDDSIPIPGLNARVIDPLVGLLPGIGDTIGALLSSYIWRLRMDLLRILIAIILPPLGVFLQVGIGGAFWLNILLTLLGYIPGIVHAVWIIAKR